MNTFPCTQTIEEGTLALRETNEYRTDQDLYHVIRLQRIIENIDKIATATDEDSDTQSAYLRVRSELEEFRAFLCSDVGDSRKSHIPNMNISQHLIKDHRFPVHAIPYCEIVPLSSCLLRKKSSTVAFAPSEYIV